MEAKRRNVPNGFHGEFSKMFLEDEVLVGRYAVMFYVMKFVRPTLKTQNGGGHQLQFGSFPIFLMESINWESLPWKVYTGNSYYNG